MRRSLKLFLFAITLLPMQLVHGQSTTSTSAVAGAAASPIDQAIEMNVAEVDLAKMAATKSLNPHVKDFADMMVKDHTQALTKLRAIPGAPASDMKPNAQHRATADRLSKLSGDEFDREYMNTMISDHQEALDFFEHQSKATGASGNADFAKVAKALVPTVKEHLEKAKHVQKDVADQISGAKSPNPGEGNTYTHVGEVPAPGPSR